MTRTLNAPMSANPTPAAPGDTLTVGRRTQLKNAHLDVGLVSDPATGEEMEVSHVVLHSVTFRSPLPLSPGSLRQIKAQNGEARVASVVRVVSSRLRPDGTYDIKAEFY